MKILHLSDEGLPDWRIEKSAISASNLGYEIFFAGNDSINYHNKIFSKIYEIKWTAKARYGISTHWHYVKKEIRKVVEEIKPDIVHAHNVCSAKMMSEFGLPFIYDDHEYWSQYSRLKSEMGDKLCWKDKSPANVVKTLAKRIITNQHALRLWTSWEKDVVSSAPTITVADIIVKELKGIGGTDKVFVVPNYPMKFEVEKLKPRLHNNLSSVYAGSDGSLRKSPYRNIDGLPDIFTNRDIGELVIIGWDEKSSSPRIKYTGFLSRQDMFEEMSKHSIGLIPWKRHWAHYFVSPNKAYEYAHVGLFVMCTSSIIPVRETLKDICATFEDYSDLSSQLEYFKENLDVLYKKRLRTFEFARNNLVWENYEKNIFHAYQLC